MAAIRFDVSGLIESGDEQGRYVHVVDDRDATGGFVILTAADAAMAQEVYDTWVPDVEELRFVFDESNWVVEWMRAATPET